MSNYTDKEKKIIKQCNEGPFHTLITELTSKEFEELTSKLMADDDSYTLTSLIAIYRDYDLNKLINYFINKGDVELLLNFLDYCNDFCSIDQKSIVDKLLNKNDKEFIKEILKSNNLYFLTDTKEKERLANYIN